MEMEIEKLKLEKRKVRVKRDTLISLFILSSILQFAAFPFIKAVRKIAKH